MSEDTIETIRVCRECGEEYRPDILVCADCGGELEARRAGEPLERPEVQEAAQASSELEGFRPIFTGSRAMDLVPLCDRLREAGTLFRMLEQPASVEGGPARYMIFVRDADAAGALASLVDLIAPHETGGDMRAIEDGFDHQQQGYLQCPACGAKTTVGATECPECGLGLGLADE